ncbi:MAG: class I SAM-dependent methyltransferase [Cyanobacteriota bacterium]|jgi:trans-aconitate 2-methyltransferase|nr:class I SAM-dependent methyltransferase [Cyanobacteriota bacterium]
MERICEPELMDDPHQAQTYAEADYGESDRAFSAHILNLLASRTQPAPTVHKILDLGCGPGNITFLLAEALPQTPVLGVDGAAAMLSLAEQRRARDPQRWAHVHVHQALLPVAANALAALPAPLAPPYDLIVSNSLLHHLHDPGALWRTVQALGAPGALVVVRDLRRPPNPEALQELVERHAAAAPPVLRRDYANSLAAAFRPEEVEAQLLAAGLAGMRVEAVADVYLDVSGQL